MHEVAAAYLEKHLDYEEMGRLRFRALFETGYPGWYAWRIVNWGTKSNAHSFRLVSDEPLEFLFDTAWEFPWPVFEELVRVFPSLQFKCLSFEEGGNFGGEGCFNPTPGERPYECCTATEELSERVFGKNILNENLTKLQTSLASKTKGARSPRTSKLSNTAKRSRPS